MLSRVNQFVLCCLAAPVAWASLDELPRTDDEFVIDGELSEAAWQEAMRIDLTVETNPGENLEAPVATRAFLIEDGENQDTSRP